MEFHLEEGLEILERTPATLSALLSGVSDAWLNCREGPGTFSPVDVIGHLICGEQVDWIPRARIILECGESRPFDPFDRVGFEPIIQGKTIASLLDTFAALRQQNLATLGDLRLDAAALDRTGIHPALGRVTMRQLLAAWAVHDLGHIRQIVRVMAGRYAAAVGPWRPYLTILDDRPES